MTWIIPNNNYQELINWATSNKTRIRKHLNLLKRMRKGAVDKLIHALHEEAFDHINCLECGNCCGSLGPRITEKDIQVLTKSLGKNEEKIKRQYLKIDEDNDLIFNSLPCPFLNTNVTCSVYHDHPRACKTYPHTDQPNQVSLLTLMLKNSSICPAVAYITKSLVEKES
jgi:Fe-S-cluster containining protein